MVSTTEAPRPALEAWVRLLRGHAAATRALNAQLLRDHELTINDYEALLLLGVTRLLEGLERGGLVEKAACPRDGRVTYAVLTDRGRTKLAQASCSHVAAIDRLFAPYTPDELATLASLLGRLPEAHRTRCALADSGDPVAVEPAVAGAE